MSINFCSVAVLTILFFAETRLGTAEESKDENLHEFAVARIGSTNYWHGHRFNLVALSADGKVMATAGAGDPRYLRKGQLTNGAFVIRVWQSRTGKLIHEFQLADVTRLLSLSPDGNKMASFDGNVFRLWDLKTGIQTHRLMAADFADIKHVQFLANGTRVVTFSSGDITHWDCATGKRLRTVEIADGPVQVDAVSRDSTLLATGVGGEAIHLLSAESGKSVRTIASEAAIKHIAFSPTGKLLAVSIGSLINVFDTDNGTLVEQVTLEQSRATTIFFASDGKLGWIDSRRCLRLIDRMTQDRVLVSQHVGREGIAHSQDGKLIAVAGGPWARVWDLRTGKNLLEDAGVVTNRVSLGSSPDGKVLVTRDGRSIKFHDPRSGHLIRQVPAEGHGIRFSPCSRLFCGFTGPSRNEIGIWEMKTGRQVGKFEIRPQNRVSFGFSQDGTKLICIDRTGEVARWNIADGTRLKSWQVPREWHDVALSPDGRTLISPPAHKAPTRPFENEWSISLLDIESRKKLWSVSVRNPSEGAMHFSQEGTRVLSTRGRLLILDARTGRLEKSATLSHTLTGIQVSPKLDTFVGITAGILRVWSVESGKEIVSLGSSRDKAASVRFSPDGETLYSASTNGTVLIWDLRQARLAATPISPNRFVASFNPDALPLHRAAQMGLLDEVKALLGDGSAVNAITEAGTPLHFAARHGHVDVVKALLDANADPDQQIPGSGAAPLHLAAAAGSATVVKVLLEAGANHNAATTGGIMPLHVACRAGSADVVQLLLDQGADPSVAVGRNRVTPLHFACGAGAAKVFALLIDAGAQVNAQLRNGMTPLIVAARGGTLDAIKRLIEGGADVNFTPPAATNALSGAAHFGHGDVVLYLLRNGAHLPDDLGQPELDEKSLENLETVRDRLIQKNRKEQ